MRFALRLLCLALIAFVGLSTWRTNPIMNAGGLDYTQPSSTFLTHYVTVGNTFSGPPLLVVSILSFTAANQKDMDVAVNVLDQTRTVFTIDIRYGSGLDFTMLWIGILALDPDGSFPYIYLWHDIPYSSTDCNFRVKIVSPLATGTGVRSATTKFTFPATDHTINIANNIVVQVYIQGLKMHTNNDNYNISMGCTVFDAQTIAVTAATSGNTTVPLLNYSILVYDVTLLTAQPNIFVDYGALSANAGNWSALALDKLLVWWDSAGEVNFMVGLSGFSYLGNQAIDFTFDYPTMLWKSSSAFLKISVNYWNYREAVPCAAGYQLDPTTSNCAEICGDGILFYLACDDGNTKSGDGCSPTCALETGWSCPGGSSTTSSTCAEICGDGLLFTLPCDDGNKVNGDGCSATCVLETGFNCIGGSTTTKTTCTEICGDGILFYLACDDGNTKSGDGCSPTCALETGWSCPGGSSTTSSTCAEICGDGLLFTLPCDDGNKVNGDGCSSACLIEANYMCSGGNATSKSICSQICGDGVLIYLPCDDGNTVSGDGCSQTCSIEDTWNCTGGNLTAPSVCYQLLQLEIELVTTIKQINNNSVAFYFSISPVIPELASLDYSQVLITNMSGVGLTFTYLGDGSLEVLVDYNTTDIQDQTIDVLLDPTKSSLAYFLHYIPTTYSFVVDPDNNIPAYPYDEGTYQSAQTLRWIALLLSFIFIGVFLVSLFTKRYIGVEMMGVAQVAFFGLMIVDDWEPTLASFSAMRYVNGYNAPIKDNSADLAMETPRRLSGLQLDSPLVFNFNYVITIMIFPMFLALVFYVASKATKIFTRQVKLLELSRVCMCQYGLTAVILLEYQWFAAWEIFVSYEHHADLMELPSSLAVIVVSTTIIVGLLVLFKLRPAPFGEYKTAFRSTTFCQNYYWVPMGTRACLISAMVFGNDFRYTGFFCILVPTANIIVLSLKKPYKSKGDVYRAIGNEALTLGILLIYTYYGAFVVFEDHSQTINRILPYFVLAMLCACLALNLAFIIKAIALYIREKRQFKEDQKMAAKYQQDSKDNEGLNRAVMMLKKRETSVAMANQKQLDMKKFMQPESVSPIMRAIKREDSSLERSLNVTAINKQKRTSRKIVEATVKNTLLEKHPQPTPEAELEMPTLSEIKQRFFKNSK